MFLYIYIYINHIYSKKQTQHSVIIYKTHHKKFTIFTAMVDDAPRSFDNITSGRRPWYSRASRCLCSWNSPVTIRKRQSTKEQLLKMKRDDEYILMMLEHFVKFYQRFVRTGTAPPNNFNEDDDESFQILVKRTKRIAARCSTVRRTSPGQVQRSPLF